MHTRIFSFILTLALVLDVSAHPSRCDTGYNSDKAIYMLTNDAKNAVVALPIGADGKLSKGTYIETGGAGSNSVVGSTGELAGPDALVSQSSLTVAGNVCVIEGIFNLCENSSNIVSFSTYLPSTLDQTPSPCSPSTDTTLRSSPWLANP
jgi:hypothetical protein